MCIPLLTPVHDNLIFCLPQGAEISIPVIRNVTPDLTKLGSVSCLATSLYHRDLIKQDDLNRVLQPTAARDTLTWILINASHESYGRGKHIVENLYLSLLDVFLDKCNQSCHDIAMNVLRENGKLNKLKFQK